MPVYIMEEDSILHNGTVLQKLAGDRVIWGVVKGNGYGLGTVNLARALAKCGIRHFAVSEVWEARALRQAGFCRESILMLRGTADAREVYELLQMRVILTISSPRDMEIAELMGIPGQVHLKIDTGMGRYGFLPGEIMELADCFRHPRIQVTGVYTHFFDANSRRKTKKQYDLFQKTIRALKARDLDTGMVHCCSSNAFLRYPEMRCDAVRLGSALLGRVPFWLEVGLRPVGYCLCHVTEKRVLPAGHTVGYHGWYRTIRRTETAVLNVGYAQGLGLERAALTRQPAEYLHTILHEVKTLFQRELPEVTISGLPCRVLGQVGMSAVIVDVTGCPCQIGDTVRLEISPLYQKNMEVLPGLRSLSDKSREAIWEMQA